MEMSFAPKNLSLNMAPWGTVLTIPKTYAQNEDLQEKIKKELGIVSVNASLLQNKRN